MSISSRRVHRVPSLVAICAAFGLLVGCGGGKTKAIEAQGPLGIIRDRANSESMREAAVLELRQQASAGTRIGQIAPRDVYKQIAWTPTEPAKLRAAVVDSLLNDSDPAVVTDAKEMAKALLPKEGTRPVVVTICRNAGTKGWAEFTPAIVRAYARTLPGVGEDDRVERKAISDLNPGKSVEETVFGVFLHPPALPPTEDIDWTMRFRSDAWNVLARIDKSGQTRARLLEAVGTVSGDFVLDAVRAAKQDLRVVPITGEELAWLSRLRDPKRKENAGWWREAAAAVATISASATGSDGLRLRHIEAARWAAANQKQWLTMSREQLLSELSARLGTRKKYPRTAKEGNSSGPTRSELLEKRAGELTWGDLLSILVIDEAIHQPQVVSALFAQAQADREDKTTEYGGLLAWKQGATTPGASPSEHSVVMLYMPRSPQRISDTKFIASDDMLTTGDLSLAHYHFHVQKEKNADFAGPSGGDLEYADRHGRSCVVFTSVKDGIMAIDYYQPGDVVIDLGGLVRSGG